jgi:hypothetical protein
MDPAASAQAQAGEVQAAAAGSLRASPAQVLPSAAGLTRAEPMEFSLGVQYDAYYGVPTADMPGYPAGYWQADPSPFAAMASISPIW